MLSPMTTRALCLIAAALLWTAACGGKRGVGPKQAKPDEVGDETSDDPKEREEPASNPLDMVTQIEWVVTTSASEPPMTEVMISLTDETGAVEHATIGTFRGACTDGIGDDDVAGAILGLRCWHAGAGDSLRIVRQGSELIVLRALLEEEPSAPGEVGEVTYDIYGRVEIRKDSVVRVPAS